MPAFRAAVASAMYGPPPEWSDRRPTLTATSENLGFAHGFLDTLFGLGPLTPSERSWIGGGRAGQEILASFADGAVRGLLRDIASAAGWTGCSCSADSTDSRPQCILFIAPHAVVKPPMRLLSAVDGPFSACHAQ